jgi:hypothetical protein
MNLVLKDRTVALLWLSENYHERRFFGNLVPQWRKTLENLKPLQVHERKPKRVQRKRGYQDHGTLRPSERWTEKYDWSFTEEQNLIEEQREIIEDTAALLEGWLS